MTPYGKLWVVPTPLGNLGDITLRALEVLKEVDFILTEDTRTSGNLLRHFGISKPLFAYHKFNEHRNTIHLTGRIAGGENAALISDAGTPGISDPGYLLIRACLDADIEVDCLPGATALIPALVNSGLPADRFTFEGFLPVKKGRNKRLESLRSEERTMIFYEAPFRVIKTLGDLSLHLGGGRSASVSRELSKLHEERIRGSLEELKQHFTEHPPRGEFVLVVQGMSKKTRDIVEDHES